MDGPLDTAKLAKYVDKGLQQLKGATRAIRSGSPLSETHQGIPVLARQARAPIRILDRNWVVLGLVVVPDLDCDVDWRIVAERYLVASSGNACYQVVDLTELRSLVGAAKTPMQFVTNLILRFQRVNEFESMAVRVRIRRYDENS